MPKGMLYLGQFRLRPTSFFYLGQQGAGSHTMTEPTHVRFWWSMVWPGHNSTRKHPERAKKQTKCGAGEGKTKAIFWTVWRRGCNGSVPESPQFFEIIENKQRKLENIRFYSGDIGPDRSALKCTESTSRRFLLPYGSRLLFQGHIFALRLGAVVFFRAL